MARTRLLVQWNKWFYNRIVASTGRCTNGIYQGKKKIKKGRRNNRFPFNFSICYTINVCLIMCQSLIKQDTVS